MASKFALAGGIPERRVRPVWDAIDSRQFKNALKITTSLLSKYPNSPYALSLKALIFERMGKLDEALSICLNAKELLYKSDALLMDDLTLSTMQIVFQRLERLDLATSCYEHACGKFTNNLELMMGLFNCYVREYSFVKQQQTAIKMYKLAGEERYLLWAVCSIQLQVLCDKGGEKLLLLAEALLKKHIGAHSLHEPEALMVYISILEQQSKYNDALDLLSGKLGSLLVMEVDKLRIQGRLLARAGDYTSAADVYKKILELSPDDWECFLQYLGCLLEDYSSCPPGIVENKLSHLTDAKFENGISNASDFVQKLQAGISNSHLRGPCLANLEIERRKCLYGRDNEDKLIEALVEYYNKFCHMASFTSDVEGCLQALSPDKKIDFVKLLKSAAPLSADPIKILGQSIANFKILEVTGNMYKLPSHDLESSAVQMTELFCKNLPLSNELDPQETMHGEELLSMVCNVLVQLFQNTRHVGYLVEAIMVLEFGLTIRRFVSQYKILLLHLYSHLGALQLAFERYKSLDVKNILMETVSHHILPQMLMSPLWVDLNSLLKDYLKFMDDHFRESADLTFLAYRHRNYSKVIEFVRFKERLQLSNQYLMARVEVPLLQLKQNADNIEEEESILENLKCGTPFVELSDEIMSKSLSFNEDLQSRPWWTPVPGKNYLLGPFEGISYYPKENLVEERERNVRKTIERRSLLPRMIYLSIQSASASLKDSIEVNDSVSDPKISSELRSLLECYAQTLQCPLSGAVQLVSGVSSGIKTLEALGSESVEWLTFAVFWNALNLGSHGAVQPEGEKSGPCSWHVVNSLLEKLILEKVRSMDPITVPLQALPHILVQLVSEPLAWHSLVIQACLRFSLPSGKKKKKGGPSDQTSSSPMAKLMRDSLLILHRIVEEVLCWCTKQINKPEDDYVEALLYSLKGKGPGQVFKVLETSVSNRKEAELGDRISLALNSWSSADVAREMVSGQRKVLSEFCQICESKLKLLASMKQQTAHF